MKDLFLGFTSFWIGVVAVYSCNDSQAPSPKPVDVETIDALPMVDFDARETTAVDTGADVRCSCDCVPALGNACVGWDGGSCSGQCCRCPWDCAPIGCFTGTVPEWCCP